MAASVADTSSSSRFKTLKVLLPQEVTFVHSYVTWMEELAENVETSAITKADSLENYLKFILENEKKSQISETGKATCGEIEEGAEDEDSDWMDNVGHAAMKLNVAAMYTYIGDFTSAKGHLDHLKNENLAKLKLTSKHQKVIEYCRDSLSWALGVLKGLEEQKSDGSLFFIKGSSKLNCMWEELEDGDEQIQATLRFLKACLSAAMKVSEETTLVLLMEATKLDPECHIWYHYAYRIMRRIRRNIKRSIGARLSPPSEEEERLAKKAYDLCPEDVVTLSDYGLLIKEKLWMARKEVWDENEEEYLKCVQLFEKALKLAMVDANQYYKWPRKIKVYLAEFLVFGKGDKLDRVAGKRMFDECAVEYPTSTFVLHKVGKLYHHGIFNSSAIERGPGEFVDLQRAKEYYKRAIDSNPSNFACLMDYLKLLRRLQEYGEMIRIIDDISKSALRDYQVAKLYIIRAFITWIFNPKNLPDYKSVAVDGLMFVVKSLPPEFAKEVFYTNDPICFDREHSSIKVRKEVLDYVEGTKQECQDEEELAHIEKFIKRLSGSVNRAQRPQNDWSSIRKPRANAEGGTEDLADKMKGLTVSSRGRGIQRHRGDNQQHGSEEAAYSSKGAGAENKRRSNQGRGRSVADEDNSWRKKE